MFLCAVWKSKLIAKWAPVQTIVSIQQLTFYLLTLFHRISFVLTRRVAVVEGAVSTEHPSNPRKYHGQRKPRKIRIENYAAADCSEEDRKGLLPVSSREATPLDEDDVELSGSAEFTENKTFFSGNPFVEVTKGIIHMYKKK